LFGHFKNPVRNNSFASDHELKEAVRVWLVVQLKTFFCAGIQILCVAGPDMSESKWTALKYDALMGSVFFVFILLTT
jgi:hypothetical protein